jgi:hypothetical protein
MRPLTRADIRGPAIYAGMRDDLRRHVIAHKQDRRVIVGDRVSLVFEDRTTLIFQIEEILRVEHITVPAKIDEEIAVYNELLPTADSLSATLFLELPPDADARAELGRLIGLDEHVVLHIGPHPVRAAFEAGRSDGDRISAVQYTRYRLDEAARASLKTPGTPLALEIDHPAYRHRVALSEASRASLARDIGE